MAFWKKSEDPWDMDPSKRRPAIREEEEKPDPVRPVDDSQAWEEEPQTEENREESANPMTCPWCGKKMELGYLYSGDSIRWVDREPGAFLGALTAGKELYVSDEGVTTEYKKCW